jgi:hypothetical protein
MDLWMGITPKQNSVNKMWEGVNLFKSSDEGIKAIFLL